MKTLHVDIAQVSRSAWRGYISEYGIHVNAETRNDLLEEVTQEAAEKFGDVNFMLVVNQV